MADLLRLSPDLLQAIGALIVLWSSLRTRRRLLALKPTFNQIGDLIMSTRDAVAGQARDQAIGFLVIVTGLGLKVWFGA